MDSCSGMYSAVVGTTRKKAKLLFPLTAIWSLLLFITPLQAEPWAPEPNVAEDVGNWISATHQQLQIRLNGFHGYKTTRALGIGDKLHHPQHIVRLPNHVGADGKMHAYFAISQSWRFYSDSKARYVTDGYWMVAEMDADAYDAETDQIVDTPGSDGQYVFEEHFSNGKDELRDEYSDDFAAKGSQMVISTAGDWQHPCKMVAFGGLLAMVGQSWTPLAAVGTPGDSQDAVLFYDVRDPVHPKYLGLIDSVQLGIPEEDQTGALGIFRTPEADWRQIDILGLAKFSNGYYHMGVVNYNYFCHESQDCFNNPAAPGKWVPEALAPGETTQRMGGAQGENFSSYEKYDSVPAQDEPCYGRGGVLYPGGSEKPAECQPAGTRRVFFFEALDNSVLEGDENDGIPLFYTLTYERDGIRTFEPSGPSDHYLGFTRAGLETGQDIKDSLHLLRQKAEFYTQLTGNCAPGGGLHVNDRGVVEIFCVTESGSEPVDCSGEAGECNRLWQNAAAAAPSYGAIKFTAAGGHSVVYRGRGLTDMAILNQPPWGPGGNGPVDWTSAAIYQVEALSGDWLIYDNINFEGLDVSLDLLRAGQKQDWNSSAFRIRSFRTLPEKGITLFEHNNYYGRMVNTVRSNDAIPFSCGDNALLCAYLDRSECNIFGRNCDYPRTFNDKASSLIVSDGEWSLFSGIFSGRNVAPFNRVNAGFGMIGNLNQNDWQIGDDVSSAFSTTVCTAPTAPTALSYTLPAVGRPYITWSTTDSSVDSYKIELSSASLTSTPPPVYAKFFVPSSALPAGTYEITVIGIRPGSSTCAPELSPPSEKLTVFIPEIPVGLNIEIVSTDVAGLGTGTVTVDELPASEIGGNFYIPGDTVTLRATPTARAEFATWHGDAQVCGATPICQLTVPVGNDLNVRAIFRPKPSLVVFSVGAGMRDANDEFVAGGTIAISPQGVPCANTGYTCLIYSTGANVTLSATARPDTVFEGWQGDDDCADGSVTMSHNVRCEAVFSDTRHRLFVDRTPGVEVSSSPAGIDCGTASDCEGSYLISEGEKTVTLTAVIDPGYVFIRWSGSFDCWDEDEADSNVLTANVVVGGEDVSCSVVAVPADTQYALTIEKLGSGTVTAVTSPAADSSGIDCSLSACSQSYGVNTQVQLTANASGGAEFVGFESTDAGSDDYNQDEDDCIDGQINMIENVSCVALFKTNVLVVNGDDDASSKEQNPYVNVLNNMDLVDFDIWHIQNPNSGDNSTDPETGLRRVEPSAEDLAKYGRVIWYTGAATADPNTFSPTAGPSAEAEASLAEYLDNGGCLLMSSPQYHKDRGLTPFMQNYLGVSAITEDVAESYVKGAGSPSLGFSKLTTEANAGTANEGYFSFREGGDSISDSMTHDPDLVPGSDVLLTYREGHGEAAVAVDNGVYRSAFFGFPFLGLPSGDSQNSTMRAFLDFCGKPETDDLFEVNDDFASAVERKGDLELSALKILPGNQDYFKWTSDWYADTRFRISFLPSNGNLDLAVYDSAKKLIAKSQTQNDTEEVIIANVNAGETYYVQVYGSPLDAGASSPYKLTIERASENDRDHDGVADVDDPIPFDDGEQSDTDGDLIGDNADPDDDNDGMPDTYEIQFGLDSLIANTGDSDGDGFSDLDEYRAGTDPTDPNSKPVSDLLESEDGFKISAGLNDVWYNPATDGQGFFVTVFPEIESVFLAWFTYDTTQFEEGAAANLGDSRQRWLTALGSYAGDQAELDITISSGGLFDDGALTSGVLDGTITLQFDSCTTGTVTYKIPSSGLSGTVPIQRIVSDNVAPCQELESSTSSVKSGSGLNSVSTLAVDPPINAGMNDTWYNPETNGQGFFVTVFPNIEKVYISWFTYDTALPGEDAPAILGDAGQRWLTAIGDIAGNEAVMDITISSGGIFDKRSEIAGRSDGTITLRFDSCVSGSVEYDIPSIGQQGTVPIQRIVNDNAGLCETLSTP